MGVKELRARGKVARSQRGGRKIMEIGKEMAGRTWREQGKQQKA